jgi:hypothetical protein
MNSIAEVGLLEPVSKWLEEIRPNLLFFVVEQ